MLRPFLLIPAALALCAAGCDRGQPPEGRSRSATPVHVLVSPLQIEPTRTRVEAVGTSRAIRSIELHPATSGEVAAVHFEPGQRVSKGDLLVELDKRDERLAVDLARVRVEDAERLLERYRRSGSSGAVLPTQLDAAETAVETARIELERAQVALDDRTIRAPFDGYVDVTEVYPGDRINPDTVITTLDDRSALLVSFDVPELMIRELETGGEVDLSMWNFADRKFRGTVTEIGSRIDPATRTFVARATVDNASDALRPGMSFQVSVSVEGATKPVVSETAVQWGADGAFIWTIVDGRAVRVPVRIVQRQQGRVLIETDLEPGSPIVVEGVQRMRDGIEVTVGNDATVTRGPARHEDTPRADAG